MDGEHASKVTRRIKTLAEDIDRANTAAAMTWKEDRMKRSPLGLEYVSI